MLSLMQGAAGVTAWAPYPTVWRQPSILETKRVTSRLSSLSQDAFFFLPGTRLPCNAFRELTHSCPDSHVEL